MPVIDVGTFAGMNELSDNGPLHKVAPDGGFSPHGLWEVGFDASWEIDVFGGIRRNIESADAGMGATIENYRDVLVTLLAEVAPTLRGRSDLPATARVCERERADPNPSARARPGSVRDRHQLRLGCRSGRASTSIDAYTLRTRSGCVLNLVNRLRCPRTGTAAILLSLAIRPDEF